MLSNVSCVLMCADCFQNHLFFNISGIPSVSNKLDSDQAQHIVWPDLGHNYMQRLSADGTSK